MEYYDEELLEAKRELERKKYTTLETGMYAGEELIQFADRTLPGSDICLPLPVRFVEMPEFVRAVKYPSGYAPKWIMTSLDTLVNFAFNRLDIKDGDIKAMGNQFQRALRNLNPSIRMKEPVLSGTGQGNEMLWFDYTGYSLDGQSYNRVYLIKMKGSVLHGVFNCELKDKEKWEMIVEKVFMAVEEGC